MPDKLGIFSIKEIISEIKSISIKPIYVLIGNDAYLQSFFIDQSYVFESKAAIDTNLSYLYNNFDFPRSRFSKYERGLDSLLK